jgi:hypothetical protein
MSDVVMLPISYILKNVVSSCDFGMVDEYLGDTLDEQRTTFWMNVISSKARDTGFGHLVESILEHGFTGSAIGWDDVDKEITEGHHRLVAAILLGMDEIPTCGWGFNGNHAPTPGNTWFSAHRSDDKYPIDVEF